MRKLGICLSSVLVVLGTALAVSAQTIRVGSVANSRFGTAWTLDGSQMVNTRAKLLNAANFGPAGTVPRPIAITDTAGAAGSVNAALLAGFDVFFIGYLGDASSNAFTAAELVAFSTWVNAGGTMVVTCDDKNFDTVCDYFGHPASTGSPSINPIVPTAAGASHPLFNGPFGTVTAINMSGTQGAFTSTTGATILAQDSNPGTPVPTVLFQAFGAGRVVFMSDVDLIANGASAGSAITTQNDKFTGNVFAYAASCTPVALCLSSSRFRVTAAWQSPSASGQGTAVGLTPDTGYFWFFNSANVEMVVKVLDACSINVKKWVFAGGLTNVNVVLTVTDIQTGAVRTYINPQSTAFQPIQDTSAFSTCP